MATPHVSGTIALLREAIPGAKKKQILAALEASAASDGMPDKNELGWGWLDIREAINKL